MRATALAALFFCIAAVTVSGQERPGWIYSSGAGEAETEREALRLAKADAITEAFRDLRKDELFESMFLSDWPDAVEVERQSVEEQSRAGRTNGDPPPTYRATVRIAIDQNAVILAEAPYTTAATGLLNRADTLIQDAETATRKASEYEGELNIQDAFGYYRRAEALLSEARIVLTPIGDDSVFSDAGGNASSLLTTIAGLSATVSTGLARIERLSSEIASEQGRRQHREVLSQVEERIAAADSIIQSYIPQSPFYDLPGDQLESIHSSLALTRSDLAAIIENLQSIRAALPENEEMAAKRVDLGLSTAERLFDHTTRMIGEVDTEIDYPRLERQEDEARRKRRREAVSRAARWVLFHQPSDYLSYARSLPFLIDHRDGRSRLPAAEWRLQAEATFEPGIWLHAGLRRGVHSGESELYRTALTQSVGFGVVGRRIWGLGYAWDWVAYESEERDDELEADRELALYLGRPNRNLRRADIMVSLSYRIPRYWGGIVVPYHLNGRLSAVVRLEHLLVLEAMGRSGIVAAIPEGRSADVSTEFIRNQPYQLEWRTGVGLRLPPPVAVKVFYGETYERPENRLDAGLGRIRRGWSFAIEYTI